MLALVDLQGDDLPSEPQQRIRDHAERSTTITAVRDYILDFQIYRTWSGDCTNLRLAVANELQEILLSIMRMLIHLGGRLRYGPPPRGPLERSVTSALRAHMDGVVHNASVRR